MTVDLWAGKTSSTIIIDSGTDNLTTIEYTRNIHKYESESDYKTIRTELLTYGDKAAQEVINYFKATRI